MWLVKGMKDWAPRRTIPFGPGSMTNGNGRKNVKYFIPIHTFYTKPELFCQRYGLQSLWCRASAAVARILSIISFSHFYCRPYPSWQYTWPAEYLYIYIYIWMTYFYLWTAIEPICVYRAIQTYSSDDVFRIRKLLDVRNYLRMMCV
jgi:hypothetical protein